MAELSFNPPATPQRISAGFVKFSLNEDLPEVFSWLNQMVGSRFIDVNLRFSLVDNIYQFQNSSHKWMYWLNMDGNYIFFKNDKDKAMFKLFWQP